MNTGINYDGINSLYNDNEFDFEEQNKVYQLLWTPKKRKNRFEDNEREYWANHKVESSINSGQMSVKSSNSKETTKRIHGKIISPLLSPFSKHCENLSPLNSWENSSHKRQKICSISKFSVEYMKSPTGERLHNDTSFSLLREETPDKIPFNVEALMEENDTPTFNLHQTDSIQEEFPFLDNKENLDINRKVNSSRTSLDQVKEPNVNKQPIVDENAPSLQNNVRIREITKAQEVKSKGSTSPESNGVAKKEQYVRKISSINKNQLSPSQFQISKVNQDDDWEESKFFGESEWKVTPKPKKRERKEKVKNTLQKLNSSSSEKQAKPCNCKKSQCKKLYWEWFLNQRICTSACSCFSCWNTEEHEEIIQEIRKAILSKNPNAFKDKLTLVNNSNKRGNKEESIAIHAKGCKCKRSKCLTGYWECHQLGAKCSDLCKCESWHNQPSSKVLETPPKKM